MTNLLSVDELAKERKVSNATIRRWVRDKKIPVQRASIRGKCFFDPLAVAEKLKGDE